jgi:cytochrome oxidase Cu insertion factor (SCO1/SenC/PrrC family)
MPDPDEVGDVPTEPVIEGSGSAPSTPLPEEDTALDAEGQSPRQPGRQRPGMALLIVLGVLVLVAGGFVVIAKRHNDQQNQPIRVSGIPSSISTPLATLMFLSPLPAKPAPEFTLVDQNGHTLSLSDFRGHAVVLEFMDSHCTDICPIVSQEFVDASHDLGPAASHAVFIAINVNANHAAVSDVAAFSQEHQLDTIPSWHFFTGSMADLQPVWNSYGVIVQVPSPTADIIHSSFIFFIDPKGNERYLANPTDDHTASGAAFLPASSLSSWGQGIALVSRALSQ